MIRILNIIKFDYIIFGLILASLYLIWSLGIKPAKQRKDVKGLLSEISTNKGYLLKQFGKEKYDFVLEANNDNKYNKIYIRVIGIPSVSSITVNSKDTWNLQHGGSGAPGRGFPNQRYLDELKPFLNLKVNDNDLKLILIYKSTLKIQRYINESELKILKYSDLVYDYKIITYEDFKNHFEDL